MRQIVLAGLFGTRESADDLISQAELPRDLTGQVVALFCRDLLSGSTSFADQLVYSLVIRRHADSVLLIGAPERFKKHMLDAAKRREVNSRVRSETAAQLTA